MNSLSNIDIQSILSVISVYGLKILGSIVIFFVGKWVVGKIALITSKLLSKSSIDETLKKFVENAIQTLLIIFVILAALSNLGINTTSFVAILGAAGLAIGMAFKDTFSNIGAGVLIIFFRPLKINDFVEAAGATGTVKEINLFTTVLKTPNNNLVIIPNSHILSSNITNYSKEEVRRVDLTFGIGYDSDIKLAKDIILKLANNNEKVLKEPLPFVGVLELADSSVNLVGRFWAKNADYWDVYFEMIENVKLEFDKNNISIPFPQMDIHLENNKCETKDNTI